MSSEPKFCPNCTARDKHYVRASHRRFNAIRAERDMYKQRMISAEAMVRLLLALEEEQQNEK